MRMRQMMVRSIPSFVLFLAAFIESGLLSAPRPAHAGKPPLHVAAAADLMPVLPHLSRDFTKRSGIPVKISWGSTGEEAMAIRHRAPYDIFLAADSVHPGGLLRE